MAETSIVTKSELAVHCRVAANTVSGWIARGQLTPPALLPDGRVALEPALAQLRLRLDPLRSEANLGAADDDETAAALPDDAARARRIKLDRDQLALDREREAALQRRGALISAEAARREFGARLGDWLNLVEARLPDLVVDRFHLGKDAVIEAKRWFRELRRAEAQAADERAKEDRP